MIKFVHVNENITARAGSFFWLKQVELGHRFKWLPIRQKKAVVAHELGHVVGRHTEWRIVCALLFFPAFVFVCWAQELLADWFAVRRGFSAELAELLADEYGGGLLQPSHATRIRFIKFHAHFYSPRFR